MVNLVSNPTTSAAFEESRVENGGEQLRLKTTKAHRVPVMPAPVPKGLPNLGNTCFFNATLQCLLNTEAIGACLDEMLQRRIHIEEPCRIKLSNANNKTLELPAMDVVIGDAAGPMTSALNGLVKEFHAGRSPNPQGLFNQVAKRVPRFRGYQQQDAQELLTQVLDGVRDEELQAIRRALTLSLPDTMEASPQLINALCSGLAKPSIDATFGGTLQQRIVCCNCGHNSLLQEPFLQLSLPLLWPSTPHATCPTHPPRSEKRQPQAVNGNVGKGGSHRPSINMAAENGSSIAAAGSQNNQPSKHQRKKEAKRKRKENKQKRVALKAIQGLILQNGVGEDVEGSVGMLGEVPPEVETNGFIEEVNGVDHPTLDAGIEETTGTAQEEEVEASITDEKEANELDEAEEEGDVEGGSNHNGIPIDMEGETLAAAVFNAQGNYDDDSSPLSLQAVLRRFTDPERLDGQNAYECEKCCSINSGGQPKERRPATKRYLINRPPPVLTLHLKRFEKVQHGKRVATKKCSARVDYPFMLDLAPFCNKTAEGVDANQNQVIYSLYGIVSHRGGLSGGHYVAYVRAGKRRATTRTTTIEEGATPSAEKGAMNGAISVGTIEAGIASLAAADNRPSGKGAKKRERQVSRLAQQLQQIGRSDGDGDQQWYCCNDSSVTPVDSKSIQRGVEAYILFYERVL